MIEWGNPIHAFDARQIAGDRIVVRYARDGEVVETLDRTTRELTRADLLICDAERPVALAGIMGLANSEIADDTTDCVLEVANFRAEVIRRSAMRLRLRTEASARFEKSLDPDMPPLVAARFAQLLREVVPGSEIRSGLRDAYAGRPPLPVIQTSVSYINERLGTTLPAEQVVSTLAALEFGVKADGDRLEVHVPGHRATKDISIAEDLVEEVGRMFGYQNIEPIHPRAPLPKPYRDPTLAFHRIVRTALSFSGGLHELSAYSFDPEPLVARIGAPDAARIGLRNPIGADATHLRARLIPGMLAALEQNRSTTDHLRAYEIGRVFRSVADAIPDQPYYLGLLTWNRQHSDWATAQTAAISELKGAITELSVRIGVALRFAAAEPQQWLHPVRLAAIELASGDRVGYVGALHPRLCELLEAGPFAALAELDLDRLQTAPRDLPAYETIVRLPPLPVDISLVVPYSVTHQQALSAIEAASIADLRRVELVDVFTGAPLPEGRKSMTYRLVFQSPERTLSKDEVAASVERIVRLSADRLGATLRA
jgi:phenylalanyl-tRNA synthetase beta chain